MTDTLTDTIAGAVAGAVADRINYDHLATLIVQKLRDAERNSINDGELIEVAAIRRQLGRRGRPMAHQTFKVNYLDTKRLTLVPGPSAAKRYVRRIDWERIKQESR